MDNMAASNYRPRGVNCPDDDEIARLLQDFDSDQSVSDEDDADWDLPISLTSVQGVLLGSGDGDDAADDETCDDMSSVQTLRPTVQDIDQHPTTSTSSRNRSYVWRAKPFPEIVLSTPSHQQLQNSSVVGTPLEYYERYLTNKLFDTAADYTNRYCLAKKGKELCTSANEIKKLFGMHLIMGCIPYPRIHMYWKNGMKLELIANTMSRDRFFLLRTCLHWVDTALPPTDENANKLWKVQPIITSVRERCLQLTRAESSYSIDEQMVPFTGMCKLKQYVKNKPRPVGLKNFVITTTYGLVIDFEFYQGKSTPLPETQLGLGPAVVIPLAATVPEGSYLYFDRYFTTIPLLDRLRELKLHATGTIMTNRIKNVHFSPDNKMKRGDIQSYVRSVEQVVAVKWRDSKCVTMASTCYGADPVASVKRWNKKEEKYDDVACPCAVSKYNQSMGGVDIHDQLLEYYRAWIKTRKWTLKVSLHLNDMAVTNAWLEYRDDCRKSSIPKNKIMDLLEFRMQVGESLLSLGPVVENDDLDAEEELPQKKVKYSALPPIDKRIDRYDHWPTVDDLKQARMCRLKECTSRTRTRCEECNVYLCLSKEKQCFKLFHTQK